MLRSNKFLNLFFILFLIAISSKVAAKNRNGDFFKTLQKSTFPRIGLAKQMNSLQVSASPLIEDLFNDKELISTNEDIHKIQTVFPDMELIKNNILILNEDRYKSGHTDVKTWSGHMMPIKEGGIAFRYTDNEYLKRSDNWQSLVEEFELHPPMTQISSNSIKTLSPIEKYEYLIGNLNFNLTQNQWNIGKEIMEQLKEIPEWAGMCHGTSPASMRYQRPVHSIFLRSSDNKNIIEFYPSDIKELLSYAWANDGGPSELLGHRCFTPLINNERQRGNCLDINPGSFHLSVIQLLGIEKWPFIIDTSAGIEVWNQTASSYSILYFRPGANALTNNIHSALMNYSDYKKRDPYASFRSTKTHFIIGINLTLSLIATTPPSSENSNQEKDDKFETVTYNYDLELDSEYKIIGGEWKSNIHPDFLWVIARDYYPKALEDYSMGSRLNNYTGEYSLDQFTIEAAHSAASKNKVLFSLLEAMIKISNNAH